MIHLIRTSAAMALAAGAAWGQHQVTIDVRAGANGNVQPIDVTPNVTTKITNCLSLPAPPLAVPLLSSLLSVTVNYPAANLRDVFEVDYPTNPASALLTLCGLFPACPVPIIDLCGPSVVQNYDYGSLHADLSVYSAAAGGGFSGGASYTRIADGSWTMNEVFEITSPTAQSIELPIHIEGDVLAAESFGDPVQTWGRARLEIVGSALGHVVNRSIAVESTDVLPTTAQIQVTDLLAVNIPAGVSTYTVALTSRSHAEAVATSAGLFGTITGSATAAVNAPNSIHVGRFRAAGGGALAAGTRVRGLLSGVEYEGLSPTPAPFRLVPGCAPSQTVLYPTAPGASVPGMLALAAGAAQRTSGTAVLYAGPEGTTTFGCGAVSLFGQEVLIDLANEPMQVQTAQFANGLATFAVTVPNIPTLVGWHLMLQTLDVDSSANLLDLSTGLAVVLG